MPSSAIRRGLAAFNVVVFCLSMPAFAQDDAVVARVGETEITESELGVAEQVFASQTADMSPEARRSLLVDDLIELELVVQAAAEEGIRDEPEYLQRVDFLADQTLRSIYLQRRLGAAVSDDAVRAEYDRLIDQMPPVREIRPMHILSSDVEAAKAVIGRLAEGEKFEDVAREVSLDEVSKAKGGDLGFVQADAILKEIGDAAADLELGEYTETPVESAFGFHVVKLAERRTRPAPDFKTLAPQIRQSLQGAAMQRISAELREETEVEKLVPDVEDNTSEDGHQH